MSAFKTSARYRTPCLVTAFLMLSASGPSEERPPTLQDLQIAARVLHFLDVPVSGDLFLAIAFNPSDAASRAEAVALVSLAGNGLSVGNLTLRPYLVAQDKLAVVAGYGAVFATTGVDQRLLGASLKQRHVPCLTRHPEQVQHGACIVAIGTEPTVSIVLNAANAAADDVHFATAFRMMVVEI